MRRRSALPSSIFCSWGCILGPTLHFLSVLPCLACCYHENSFLDNCLCSSSFPESALAIVREKKQGIEKQQNNSCTENCESQMQSLTWHSYCSVFCHLSNIIHQTYKSSTWPSSFNWSWWFSLTQSSPIKAFIFGIRLVMGHILFYGLRGWGRWGRPWARALFLTFPERRNGKNKILHAQLLWYGTDNWQCSTYL